MAEVVTRHKHSSSSSSSGSSQENMGFEKNVLEKSLEQKDSASPPIDPQSFSFVSSSGDSDRQSPAGYDPNRIPSSIFSSKPATPLEWSVASSESLFSIQIGNSSFTRDHAFMLNKSGEPPKAEEHVNARGSLPPPVKKKETVGTVRGDIKEESLGATGDLVDVLKADPGENEGTKVALAMEPSNSTRTRMSHQSDGTGSSNHSTLSFAFPLLAPFVSNDGRTCSVKGGSEKHDKQRQRQSEELLPKRSRGGDEEGQPRASGRWFSRLYCCRPQFS